MGKTVILDSEVHERVKKHCKKNNIKINEYINSVINDHLNFTLEKKSILPRVLKNPKGDVIETLICTDMSSEYKKNLPKDITLMRISSDGNGYIANYLQK